MRKVTCSMGVSLDGYISGPDGRFDWFMPDDEVFALTTDEIRGVGVHLLGRRLYEAMVYWETAEVIPADGDVRPGPRDEAVREFAELWRALPKVVFSTTLTSVQGNTRLLSEGLAEEIERLRAEPGEGNIAIGGAALAGAAADAGLVDEYRLRVFPVLVGGGTPFFPRNERRADLEVLEARTLASGIVYLRHRVRH